MSAGWGRKSHDWGASAFQPLAATPSKDKPHGEGRRGLLPVGIWLSELSWDYQGSEVLLVAPPVS